MYGNILIISVTYLF